MYQYKVEIIIDSEDPYSKEELTKMVKENMLSRADSAPFDIVIGDIVSTESNFSELRIT